MKFFFYLTNIFNEQTAVPPQALMNTYFVYEDIHGMQKDNNNQDANILDGCYHVYLDVGSNTGVQVRKLYQPEHFPNAGIINHFRLAFGGWVLKWVQCLLNVVSNDT